MFFGTGFLLSPAAGILCGRRSSVFSALPSVARFFVGSIARPSSFLRRGWQNCQEFASASVIITWLWWTRRVAPPRRLFRLLQAAAGEEADQSGKESIPRTED